MADTSTLAFEVVEHGPQQIADGHDRLLGGKTGSLQQLPARDGSNDLPIAVGMVAFAAAFAFPPSLTVSGPAAFALVFG